MVFNKMKLKQIISVILILLVIGAFWFFRSNSSEQIVIKGETMGTYYIVKIVSPPQDLSQEELKLELDELLVGINKIMSTYDKNSELSLFNQSNNIQPQAISNELATVIDESIRIGMISNGALDVTVGELVNLWGFGTEGRPNKVPAQEQILQAKKKIGLQHLTLTSQGVAKAIPDLYVDLSSIAKGYGVDQVARFLQKKGFKNIMVDIGGELALRGKNAENLPWRIAIEKPENFERSVQQIIAATNVGVATSGDYRNYFEENGVRYSHTINPKTAAPITHKLASVTVLHESTMTADGLATALMVMGEDGMEWANKLQIPIYMVVKTQDGFKGISSIAMQKYLVK